MSDIKEFQAAAPFTSMMPYAFVACWRHPVPPGVVDYAELLPRSNSSYVAMMWPTDYDSSRKKRVLRMFAERVAKFNPRTWPEFLLINMSGAAGLMPDWRFSGDKTNEEAAVRSRQARHLVAALDIPNVVALCAAATANMIDDAVRSHEGQA